MPLIAGFRPIRKALRDVEMSLGLANYYLKRVDGAVVITYHGVAPSEEISDAWVQSIHIAPDVLKRQLEFISQHFDVVVGLDSDRLKRSANGRPLALITFDDGYKNFLTHALPVLEAVGIPATLFVTANCIEKGTRHPVYRCKSAIANLPPGSYDLDSIRERVEVSESDRATIGIALSERFKRMSWEQGVALITELESHFSGEETREINDRYSTDSPLTWQELTKVHTRGIRIGSHTMDHVILGSEQSAEVIRAQIVESRQLITQHTGNCDLFAYPNGAAPDVSKTAVEAVREAGYEQGFTTVPGVVHTSDLDEYPLILPRLSVGSNWNGFRKYVSTPWRHNSRYNTFTGLFKK